MRKKGTEEEEKMRLINAIKILRQNDLFINVPIVYIPENDPGTSRSHSASYLHGIPDVIVMQECSGRKYGVPKTDIITFDMHTMLYNILFDNRIYFYDRVKSLCFEPKEMCKEVIDQCKAFVWDVKPPRGDYGKTRAKLTGKRGGKQDDLLVTLMMIPFWRRVFLESDFHNYQKFKMIHLRKYLIEKNSFIGM